MGLKGNVAIRVSVVKPVSKACPDQSHLKVVKVDVVMRVPTVPKADPVVKASTHLSVVNMALLAARDLLDAPDKKAIVATLVRPVTPVLSVNPVKLVVQVPLVSADKMHFHLTSSKLAKTLTDDLMR